MKQAELLRLSRGSIYYLPRATSPADLEIMRRIDKLHLDYPFAGSRMLRLFLNREGFDIGRLHVSTLMKKMGIEAIYRRPNTSKPEPGHKIFPYLLRNMAVTKPNQVWAMDITYIPMAKGFVYLAAVVDWFTRRVLSWRLSISMDATFCIEALEEANIQISMDGKGAWRDNVFVERLWRTIKYEEVYLKAYDSVSSARKSLDRYLTFYNSIRPHSSLDGQTPDEAYFNLAKAIPLAA